VAAGGGAAAAALTGQRERLHLSHILLLR